MAKKPRNKKHIQDVAVAKDDGTRWVVVHGGRQVYPGSGVMRGEAERLARWLVVPASIRQVS